MTVKSCLLQFFEHFNLFKSLGNEAKFGFKSVIPVFIALVLPIVYPLCIALTYSSQTVVERTAVILDLDNSQYTRQLTVDLNATQGLKIIHYVESIDDGINAVLSRKADSFIFFPQDFTDKMKRFERGNLKVYVYATNMMIYASALTAIQTTVLDKNVEIAVERIANPKGITGEKAYNMLDPIKYDKSVLYSPTLAYGEYVCPMLFLLVFHQMALLVLSLSIGFHREKDPEFAKKSLWLTDYLWRYVFYTVFYIIGIFIVFYIYCPLFGMPHGNRIEVYKLILTLMSVNFPLTAICASFCKDKYTCFQFLLPTSLVLFSFSGYVWPRYSMVPWVRTISDWLSVQPASEILRGIVFKGKSLADFPAQLYRLFDLFVVYLVTAFILVHRSWWIWPFKMLFSLARKLQKTDKPAPQSTETSEPVKE